VSEAIHPANNLKAELKFTMQCIFQEIVNWLN
jgi:hypothetical protein